MLRFTFSGLLLHSSFMSAHDDRGHDVSSCQFPLQQKSIAKAMDNFGRFTGVDGAKASLLEGIMYVQPSNL